MSGLDNQNQLPTTIQGVNEYYQAHKQEWIQQVLDQFVRIVQDEDLLFEAVQARDSFKERNGSLYKPENKQDLQRVFAEIERPVDPQNPAYTEEVRVRDVFENPKNTATTAGMGWGFPKAFVDALLPSERVYYSAARFDAFFQAEKQHKENSFDGWKGQVLQFLGETDGFGQPLNVAEEGLEPCLDELQKDFNRDLNLPLRAAFLKEFNKNPERNYPHRAVYQAYMVAEAGLERKIAAEKADVNDEQAQKAASIRQALLNEIQLTAKQADLLPSEYCREVYEQIAARAVCHTLKEKEDYHATQNEEVSRLQSLLAYDFFCAQLKSLKAEALSEPTKKTKVLGAVLKPIELLAEDLHKRAQQIRSTLTDLEGQSDDKTKKRIAALYEELRQATAGIKSCSQFIGAKNLQEKAQVLSDMNRKQARHPHKTAWVSVGVAAVLGAIFIGLVVLTLTGVMPAFPGVGHASDFIEAGIEGVVTAAVAGAIVLAGFAKGAHVVFSKDPKGTHIRQARAAEAKLEKLEAREAAGAA